MKKVLKEIGMFVLVMGAALLFIFLCATIVYYRSNAESYKSNAESLQAELNNERFGVEKLLPCPICGEEVEFEQVSDDYHIVCDRWEDGKGCNLETGYYDTKEELVKAWNGMGGSK